MLAFFAKPIGVRSEPTRWVTTQPSLHSANRFMRACNGPRAGPVGIAARSDARLLRETNRRQIGANTVGDNPTFLAQREQVYEGLQRAACWTRRNRRPIRCSPSSRNKSASDRSQHGG